MKSIEDSVAGWATLVGSVVSLLGLIQSEPWLTSFGAFCIAGSMAVFLYARKQRALVSKATLQIEGRSIDSLNLANLNRRVNRSLFIQSVDRAIQIEGQDLRIETRHRGYCSAAHETCMQFSLDSDNTVPFDELPCYAFDLLQDPDMRHRISPLLLGTDGSAKKIAVPFLNQLANGEPFDLLLRCTLPGCMKAGIEYYTSSLSFHQDTVANYSVRLNFIGTPPEWVRAYECDQNGITTLIKELRPIAEVSHNVQYLDSVEDVPARCTRVYVFRRRAEASIQTA